MWVIWLFILKEEQAMTCPLAQALAPSGCSPLLRPAESPPEPELSVQRQPESPPGSLQPEESPPEPEPSVQRQSESPPGFLQPEESSPAPELSVLRQSELPQSGQLPSLSPACGEENQVTDYCKMWQELGYRVERKSDRYYLFLKGEYKGTLDERGNFVPKTPRRSTTAGSDDGSGESVHEDLPDYVQKWKDTGHRVDAKNGRYYVFKNNTYLGTLDEYGELNEKISHGKSATSKDMAESIREKVYHYLHRGIKPQISDCSAYEVREVGFTYALTAFVNKGWATRYHKQTLSLLRLIILKTSPFSYLRDFTRLDMDPPNFLIASEGALECVLMRRTSLTIPQLYKLMGGIFVIYTHDTAVLSQISTAQYEFCATHGIPLSNITKENGNENPVSG